MKKLRFEIDGQWVEGRAAFAKGVLWAHVNGETFAVEPEGGSRSRRGRSAAKAHAGEIAAPMPGKLIKVMAKDGEDVIEGQALVVMEAMKMEYTLKAQAGGRVKSVRAQAGDQVALGQVLLELEVSRT